MGAPKKDKAPKEDGGGKSSPVKKTIVKNEGGGAAGGGSPAKKVIVKKEGGGGGSGAAAAAAGKAKAAKGGGEAVRKPQKYKIGQDVLAYFIWKGYTHMYKARILRVRDEFTKQGQPTWQYYVHWTGWDAKWDMWVEESKVVKDDPAGRELMAKVEAEAKALAQAKRQQGKKAKDEKPEALGNIDYDFGETKEKMYRVGLSTTLQRYLMEDLDMIEDRKLIALPRKPAVSQILEAYREQKGGRTGEDDEFIDGIRILFDHSLSRLLLYRFERPQYRMLKAERGTKRDSQIYGGEHLLRMFVKVPELLHKQGVDPASLGSFQSKIVDLVKYIDKNAASLLLPQYIGADTAYMEKVEQDEAKA